MTTASTRTSRIPLPHPLTLLSAALIVASFPPWNLSFLIWVALVPWLLQLSRTSSYAQAFFQGLWLSFFMSLGGFYWVAWVLHEFGGVPWFVAGIGLLLFCIVGQPQFPIFALVYRFFQAKKLTLRAPGRELLLSVALALAYAGIDWALPKLFVDTLGHAFYASPLLRQCADLGGATLLTFLIFIWNDSIFSAWRKLRSRSEPSVYPALRESAPTLGTAALLLVCALVYGHYRGNWIRAYVNASPSYAQAAAIQANIGDFDKIASERGIRGAGENVVSTYMELSDQALGVNPKPDFLVWPETAYPSTFRTPNTSDEMLRDQQVEAFVRERGASLLFGGYDRWRGRDYNALFALGPQGDSGVQANSDLQIYRKNMLLLFGEFIPGAEQIRWLRDAFPQVGNFGRGAGPDIVTVGAAHAPGGILKTGPIICYEALFPDYVIAAARKGSQLILNITNDSWFGPYGEPYLHLALVAFRSIETRLPQLRSTNTGVSALILPDGEITHQTAINEPAILSTQIPVYPAIWTLMKAWGDWFGVVSLLAGGMLLLAFSGRSPRV